MIRDKKVDRVVQYAFYYTYFNFLFEVSQDLIILYRFFPVYIRRYNIVIIVPDRRRRILPEVVLVRRWVIGVPGIWRGEGLRKGLGQGRSVYKQPETEVDGSCQS